MRRAAVLFITSRAQYSSSAISMTFSLLVRPTRCTKSRIAAGGMLKFTPFTVIGMEGGLLAAPTSVTAITLGPGERADVVIDFAPHPAGTEILLLNSAPAPFPAQAGVGALPDGTFLTLKLTKREAYEVKATSFRTLRRMRPRRRRG